MGGIDGSGSGSGAAGLTAWFICLPSCHKPYVSQPPSFPCISGKISVPSSLINTGGAGAGADIGAAGAAVTGGANREGIEDVVLSKRRFTYEQELAENALNYDAWFDYIKLEESTGNVDRIREVRLVGLKGTGDTYTCACTQSLCVCVWGGGGGEGGLVMTFRPPPETGWAHRGWLRGCDMNSRGSSCLVVAADLKQSPHTYLTPFVSVSVGVHCALHTYPCVLCAGV